MTRQQEILILRLWRGWCAIWPRMYGHQSLEVGERGYDPVFDVIPSQAYADFYREVVRNHDKLKNLNVFEVTDVALNQVKAPETLSRPASADTVPDDADFAPNHIARGNLPLPQVTVELEEIVPEPSAERQAQRQERSKSRNSAQQRANARAQNTNVAKSA